MNKEHIAVITDREELYDKCENMEQLYDKYYLPLLDIHYRKSYELQQQNQKYKEAIDKAIEYIEKSVTTDIGIDSNNNLIHYHQLSEDETGELLEILKEVDKEVDK